jgi:DNA polymerase III epsilon subunit family exonuclease
MPSPSLPEAAQPTETDNRYSALCGRALAFVRERGGSVHEDVLVRHVFGNSGSVSIWRPLLRNVLAEVADTVVLVNEHWSLIRESTIRSSSILDAFVAIDVETTGLKPGVQRVIEIALYRYRAGQLTERYESLLNPGREIPAFIVTLTGIRNEDVEFAPVFADIADDVIEFIGDDLLVGHNVRFDISFVNAELKRAKRETLINERLDTLTMAVRYLNNLRKPSLDRVATALGLQPRDIHRAGRDAQLTAEAALRLVDIAAQTGVTSIDGLKAGASQAHRPRDDVGRARSLMDRAWLKDIPRKPGVYIMWSHHDEIIYVGKAKNLRERLASYYSQPLGYTRKMDGLIESMARVETEVVGTELQALILESQLIHRYQPRYNTALRSFEHYPYIRVDISNPWPRVSLAKQRKDDGARYYGPYRSSSGARKTIDVIHNAVPLRTCTRSFRNARSYGNPCLRLDLGKCLGPCVGQTIRDEYLGRVSEVLDFLDGHDDGLRARLWNDLEEAAVRLDFEKADKLRKDLRSALSLIEEQDRLRMAEQSHNLLLVQSSADPESREVMVILRGQIWAQVRVMRIPEIEIEGYPVEPEPQPVDDQVTVMGPSRDASDEVTVIDGVRVNDLSDRLLQIMQRYEAAPHRPVDQYVADEANIVNRWLFRNAGHPSILPLDIDRLTDRGYLVTMSLKVLSLTDEALESVMQDTLPAEDDAPKLPIDTEADS